MVEKINEPRYPSFKGIMAAKSKPIQTLSIADLGIDAGEVGLAAATTQVVSFEVAPPRQAGQTVKDDGDGADQDRRLPRVQETDLTPVIDEEKRRHG